MKKLIANIQTLFAINLYNQKKRAWWNLDPWRSLSRFYGAGMTQCNDLPTELSEEPIFRNMFVSPKRIEYLQSLPGKRIAVGVLLFDESGRLLILKPGYKNHWTIPGGVVEKGESPREALVRETKEETGLDLYAARCFAIDYLREDLAGFIDESLQMLFTAQPLSDSAIKSIVVDGQEITDHQFVELDEAKKFLSSRMVKRLPMLESFKKSGVVYFENGERI